MQRSSTTPPPLLLLLAFFNVVIAASATTSGKNPFTPKGYAIRYWRKQISNDLPEPSFLLDKASPLTAAEYAAFFKLVDDPNSVYARFTDFCIKANLFCFPDTSARLNAYSDNVNFTSYLGMNFTGYGSARIGGADTFKNYSDEARVSTDNFRRYSRESIAHKDEFAHYGAEVKLPDHSFTGYGAASTGGGGKFSNYQTHVNIPNLRFTAYSNNGIGRSQTFTAYSHDANSGDQGFTSYGKNSNGAADEFTSYGSEANSMNSRFKNYGQIGNGGKETFTSYGSNGNDPNNTFANYGNGANAAAVSFTSYRNNSNIGDDSFQSYGKKANSAEVDFKQYGEIDFDGGSASFNGYGINSSSQKTNFKVYALNSTFKTYAKKGVTFASYANESTNVVTSNKGKTVNKWAPVPGKFFREEMLKSGSVMPMPNIRDPMPKRSFLPRAIVTKIPFSTSKIDKLESIFHVSNDSSMATIIKNALNECEREPSPDETKRCVGSIEDMIDFSTSVLGRNVTVRTTDNTRGSNGKIMLGEVTGINGGNITKAVSCHQSLFPYLLYYCHLVPMVRVYEADILDPNSKSKINHGVAICHLDTSSWSPGHGAFVALGSEPGKIEVCHWIFENDMNWTTAD